MPELELLLATTRRVVPLVMRLDPYVLAILVAPVVLTAATLSPVMTLACALLSAAAIYAITLPGSDAVAHAAMIWTGSVVILLAALRDLSRRRARRAVLRDLKEIHRQLAALSVKQERDALARSSADVASTAQDEQPRVSGFLLPQSRKHAGP